MPARPRRGALGLRGRIVGAVLVTTVATLGVAALALLGPLEHSLRQEAGKTLLRDLQHASARAHFRRLDLTYVLDAAANNPPTQAKAGRQQLARLAAQQRSLGERLGATVVLWGYPNATGAGSKPVASSSDDTGSIAQNPDVSEAFRTDNQIKSFGTIDGTEVARVAIPLTIGPDGQRFVLAVRRQITEVTGAVHVVRNAFITAALAGLALTLILAIPLAATLVRRLRRLRQAALQVAREGQAVEVPVDRARDEVGDLARTFAIMQRRLQHQEEARRAFVATASHELRTPLTSLDGMLELIDDDLRGGEPDLEDARALLERARAQSRRLGRLAADLLDLSRIDAEVQLRSEPVELGELSRAVLAEFELGISERGISSALDDATGPVWALGDPGSVARILRILLDNAVRVTPDGTSVRVELHSDPAPSLTVSDEGPGVPADERELIFERFQRGRETGGKAGFGLGLAIGRELALRMGGELVLEDSDDPGARFTLKLPAARAPEAGAVALA
jgi:signal transduction histidine kinase